MRVLIFGAGVCGSFIAAYLSRGGIDVTILDRGQRYEEIKQNGIILINSQSSEKIEVKVPVITQEEYDLHPIIFDFIIVILQHNQIVGALPVLASDFSPGSDIFFLIPSNR